MPVVRLHWEKQSDGIWLLVNSETGQVQASAIRVRAARWACRLLAPRSEFLGVVYGSLDDAMIRVGNELAAPRAVVAIA